MNIAFGSLVSDTLYAPKVAAKRLMDLGLSIEIAALALGGSIAASVVVLFLMNGLQPIPVLPGAAPMGPIMMAALVAVLTGLLVVALVLCGKPFNGTGTFAQAAVLVAWTQIIQLGLQVVQLLMASVSLMMAAVFGLVSTVFMLWVLVSFINALHSLDSLGKSVIVFLLAVVGIALGLSFIFTLFGVTVPTA